MRGSRRDYLVGMGALAAASAIGGPVFAAGDAPSFADLLKEAQDDPAMVASARSFNEGRSAVLYEYTSTLGPRVRTPPSSRPISENAVQLIIAYEVSNRGHYESALRTPTLPAPPSGLTIGLGYDLGYVHPAWLEEDWPAGTFSPSDLAKLKKVCLKTGAAAAPLKASVSSVSVPWTVAEPQFRAVLKRYVGETLKHLPLDETVPPDCLGALVSLVYNRGASFDNQRKPTDHLDRFKEMREIKRLVRTGNLEGIPAQFTAMTRLWTTKANRGVARRRLAEGALFAEGLRRA